MLIARINDPETSNIIKIIKGSLSGQYIVHIITNYGPVIRMAHLKATFHDVINEALWQSKEHHVIFNN